ncbi:peptidylprolyl isomerase [Aquimarina muelleri]|uniref:Peptidylprolyl isomerase n=1 Tax=Aquimarina muelleri TaxID=279356 RepID=A0A918N3L2_9FLAO|nr:peptidylprolyl isomerase [Aquimarina muelleri]MCX2764089.1 peptidylprolyl isomerase [Aquimarina muelleri]GGX22823.1 peptidylprolyl isomerase [Aquimarina muelleri]
MAVLNKIRQRSVFLIIIIALALFSFVLADLFRNGGAISQKAENAIATINGKDIDRTEFAKKVELASRNFGGGTSSIQAVNYVWNQELRETVFEEQFEELGIRAGEDQVNQLLEESLSTNPTFQNEAGVFDKAKMQEYVANVKATSKEAYQQWLDFEINVSKGAKEQIYLNMIKAGVGSTLKEGGLEYRMENDNVDIKYVQFPFSSIEDAKVTVSDAEIKSYIDKHSSQYKAEPSRSINYVLFNEVASEEDENQVREEIASLLEDKVEFNTATKSTDSVLGFKNTDNVKEFVNQYSALKFEDSFKFKKDLPATVADTLYNLEIGGVYGPYKDGDYIKISKIVAQKQMSDSVQASHILVSWEGLGTAGEIKRTKEEAKVLADSILKVTKADKTKFIALAKEFSADNSNKDKGGDLGYFTPGRMVPAFNDYCFKNKTGDQGIVETQFGYHVISIEDQKNEQKAIQIATVAQKIEPSEKTINNIFTETTKFQISAKDKGFEEIAKKSKLAVRPVNSIKELEENIPGLGAKRTIVQWAFNEESKVGDIKRFDIPEGYAVVQLTAKTDKGVMTVADASSTIKTILLKEKKAEQLKSKISGSSLDAIAQSQGQTVKTASALNMKTPTISGAGTEPKVVGAAFALEQGKISDPIVGNNGVYVIEVTKKTPASGLDNYMSYAAQLSKAQAGVVNTKVFEALKEAAEIEDRRSKFY